MSETLNIQQQEVKLEKQAIKLGLEQFQKQTDKLEQGQYASATVYGASTIDNLLKVLTEWIEGQRIKVQSGRNGQDFAEISQYINAISSDQLALIGLKLVIDRVCDTSNEDSAILTNVYYAVGQAIERQVQLDWYEANHKELYDYVTKKYWKPTTGTEQKYTVMRLMANRRDIHWQAWHRMSLTKLGNWIVRGICDNTGWFQVTTKQRLKKKVNFLEPSSEFYLHKNEVLKVAELFTPLSYPMISEPNDWSSDAKGGYYLNEMMRGHDLVRRGDAEVLYQGAIPIAYLNNLQKVRYKINPIASEVSEWAWDRGIKIGKFLPPTYEVPKPNKPPNIGEDDEQDKAYNRAATEAYDEQQMVVKRCVRTVKEMGVKRMFEKNHYDAFYFAWSFDYRGRSYPLNAFLTVQNTDFGKSLILFEEEACMTPEAEKWLRRHTATCYGNGVDKKSWQDREAWIEEHRDQLIAVAVDPYNNIGFWSEADEPWQFMVACHEWYHCVVIKDKLTTGLPCGIDQSCSGIQFLAGATKDANAARLVNVLPGEQPQDAYMAVAMKALDWVCTKDGVTRVFPEHLKEHMSRSITKRVVMTLPYNSKTDSHRKYIGAALRELERKLKKAGSPITLTADDFKCVREAVVWAMTECFPNIMATMKKIEAWAGSAIRKGYKKLVWVTPSGFIVSQRKDIVEIEETRLQLLGKRRKSSVPGEPLGPNIHKHRNCTSPNWIHSLDASLLHFAFYDYTKPFSVIHDCCMCRATDVDEIGERMRQAYIKMFTEFDPLNDLRIALEADPDDMPPIGDLDVTQVGESPYYMA